MGKSVPWSGDLSVHDSRPPRPLGVMHTEVTWLMRKPHFDDLENNLSHVGVN